MGFVLVDELAEVRLRGFALAFDRLAKASTFFFNAKSLNCISRGFLLFVVLVFVTMRNSDPRVRIVFVYRLNSYFHSIFTL